ncbi:response regulator transcription factor [Paenibacillus graminis]|uniref:AraC family transcriptional regulator n=1 Tax=Paenibacillus graminis TaxID=189425 RepID=A0A089LY52_9BACL|nr:response regulator [Paenibacillus graminis]AIQ66421.1 AraC family transcriptional regulator [Paenibacillus graminis]
MWKVLLVEDEVFVRESVREIIAWEELGFTVCGEAGNGAEALDMIRRDVPDLVITDIIMPEMDGVELLRRTREEGYGSRFVMLTCMSDFEYVRQAMEYGASNYILKLSMSVNSLRETLRKISNELLKDGDKRGSSPAPVQEKTGTDERSTKGLQPLLHEEVTSHPEIQKILQYIHVHYPEDITVKSMSQYVMMGENYVSTLFKKKTGQTLIHYLHRVRVNQAIQYLCHSDLPVYEIGNRVGFVNDNYFIKIFKRLTAQTPSQYRQNQKSKPEPMTI